MPFPTRIQPIDYSEFLIGNNAAKPLSKSRLKRLFERPFNNVMRISSPAIFEFDPSTVLFDNLISNFMDGSGEKQLSALKCGRSRCNCFMGKSNDSSDDEFDYFSDSPNPNPSCCDNSDTLRSLVPCPTVAERNLLADASKIVEMNKSCKGKAELRKIVADGLKSLDYDTSVCKSKWEKTSSFPAGDHEYIDVIIDGDRIIIDLDFRSQFSIARPTSGFKAMLLSLPQIFVGKSDRLIQIVSIASEFARQSLRKKGLYIAPWRKAEYMKSKWLSPHTRIIQGKSSVRKPKSDSKDVRESGSILGEENSPDEYDVEVSKSSWKLPELRPEKEKKRVVTGLADLLKEKI